MKKICVYDLEGNYLKSFTDSTYKDIELDLKLENGSISMCFKNRVHKSGVYQFREYNIDRTPLKNINEVYSILRNSNTNKPVAKYFEGNVISVYNSILEASLKNDIHVSNIRLALKSKTGYSSGFIWKEIN